MGKNRDKLKKNPDTLQFLRNTNIVVGIARAAKRTKPMEKPGKNRDKKMGTPKPVNTDTTIPREIQGQEPNSGSLTRAISTGKDYINIFFHQNQTPLSNLSH
jgi:hypothetical protein